MDCHSPGQGLMPASFKVRAVPLDAQCLTVASIKMNRPDSAEKVVILAERRISRDKPGEIYRKAVTVVSNMVYCRIPCGKAPPC
ncbi:hypothetical protein V6N13_000797 [Hibiscus sabdariffa]|uniref:Uncharacterized protein n=1 Tax=Hibiscus sabdariffa TaxID=183260 RepID=A0ABR2G6D9_9ROSI